MSNMQKELDMPAKNCEILNAYIMIKMFSFPNVCIFLQSHFIMYRITAWFFSFLCSSGHEKAFTVIFIIITIIIMVIDVFLLFL